MFEKKCFKCNVIKPISQFYKHKEMADGHLNKCKDCTKSDVTNRRKENIDYVREYDRNRGSLVHRVNARLKYSQTEKGKCNLRLSKKSYIDRNTIKRAAHILIGNYVKSGLIAKPVNCEQCEKHDMRLHGHHDDYGKPLEVRWLCNKCHRLWHKEHGEALNG